MHRKNFKSGRIASSLVAIAPAIAMVAIAAPFAHAQGFININTSGNGSASAAGQDFTGGPQGIITQSPDNESFTGVNNSTSAGNSTEVNASANNTFSQTSTTLSLSTYADVNWPDSSDPDGPWQPNASADASATVIFEVPSVGAYKLDPTGGGPFATSQELAQLSDTVTVTGFQGSNEVLDLSFQDGQGWTPPGSDLFTLTPGTIYTATVSSSVIGAPYDAPPTLPAEPDSEVASVTITSVPEPATVCATIAVGAILLTRRRRSV